MEQYYYYNCCLRTETIV